MTKDQLMEKLRDIAKYWRSDTFLYTAENQEETCLLYQLVADHKIGYGGFTWGNQPYQYAVTIR